MGKAVLIILLSSIIIYGIVSIQVNRSTSEAGISSVNYYKDIYARNIANSMIEILKNKLTNDTNYRVQDYYVEEILGGEVAYRLIDTVLNSIRYVKANVIANYLGTNRNTEAYFLISKLGSGGVPPFLRYAIVSGSNLNFNGGITITNAGNNLNANVHVNGNFFMNGNNFINGFLSYTGSAYSNPPNALFRRINPISNPENLPTHYQTSTLEIPEFDPDEIRTKATQIYFGNKTFNGNIPLGTKENPEIIYVTGDLIINGSITGYGIFVSRGKTIINGNVSLTNPDNIVSNIGIYSGGELIANGNVTLNAQVFSSKRVVFNGNVKVYGSVVSKESINMNGNVTVYYKPVGEELVSPVWSTSSTGNMVQVRTVLIYE